jgi:hypothetical protein
MLRPNTGMMLRVPEVVRREEAIGVAKKKAAKKKK